MKQQDDIVNGPTGIPGVQGSMVNPDMSYKELLSLAYELERDIIEFAKWTRHLDNGTTHYNPFTKEETESIGYSPDECMSNIEDDENLDDGDIISLYHEFRWLREHQNLKNTE